MPRIDPTTLSVVWGGLVAIAEEMGVTLRSTAYSEAVREGMDLSPGLFDAKGRLVAQGSFSPGHLGAMPFTVKHAMAAYAPEKLEPGDSILLNDCFLGSGHLPDFYSITPIFYKDEIVGYAVNCAHHVDVGGVGPGSQGVEGVSDYYQEGLRILPIKHFKAGKPNEEVFKMIEANTRAPHKVIGDLKAQRNANRVAEVRVQELIDIYGLDTVNACMDELILRTEAATRHGIEQIPNGRYVFEDYLDDCGRGTEPIKLKVTAEVRDDDITFDFTGTSPQTESGMNSYINYTYAYSFFCVKCITDPFIPQNEGGIRPIKVVAPEGCFLNPRPPAAGGARAVVCFRLCDVVLGALAQAVPEKVAASSGHWVNPNFGGIDPHTGRRFVCYDVILGGMGARPTVDGCDGICACFNARNIPVEVCENNFPLLVERVEFIQDSAGAGKYRGGTGLRKDFKFLGEQGKLMNLSDRQKFAPYGLLGAKPGTLGATILNPGPNEQVIHSKESRNLQYDDVVSFRIPGSGGYGSPLERDPQAVLSDVINGYISAEKARADYGVVIHDEPPTLNIEETERLKKHMKEEENG